MPTAVSFATRKTEPSRDLCDASFRRHIFPLELGYRSGNIDIRWSGRFFDGLAFDDEDEFAARVCEICDRCADRAAPDLFVELGELAADGDPAVS